MNSSPMVGAAVIASVRVPIGPAGTEPGCDGSLETFERFLEADLAGRPAAELYPGAAVHLEARLDCREDYVGLRELVLAATEWPASPG